jgi:hypothetical protein
MEGEVMGALRAGKSAAIFLLFSMGLSSAVLAQEKGSAAAGQRPEISLKKAVNTKSYQGREVEGEERQIARGDSLWRILVEEKGVSGKQFRSYIVVIRGLNPQVKNFDMLRVGDKIFIPLRPTELVEGKPIETASTEKGTGRTGTTVDYRVKAGEHLYQILRDQLNLTDQRQVAQHFALVRDLNPERKNWDSLNEGEVIRLPLTGQKIQASTSVPPALTRAPGVPPVPQSEMKSEHKTPGKPADEPPSERAAAQAKVSDWRSLLRAPAKDHLGLLARVVESVGSQMEQSGEEVIELKDGVVRFDKRNYPVLFNPLLKQRVVLDPEGNIPQSLRTKLADPSIGAPIVPIANGLSVQEAVGQLLAGLGYQALPVRQPVVIQEDGVSYEARGHWMALAPEESNRPQQIYVISLSEDGAEIPQYLLTQLGRKGLHMREISVSLPVTAERANDVRVEYGTVSPAKIWPRDKKDIVDNLFSAFAIPFGVAETLSVELQNGLRIEARSDRTFELNGKRVALFFQKFDPEIRRALEEKAGMRTAEIELASLTSREVIARVLSLFGDQMTYREHRFAVAAQDRLMVSAWGFHIPQRSLFITDRKIPGSLDRFFSEKGLEIVYFH